MWLKFKRKIQRQGFWSSVKDVPIFIYYILFSRIKLLLAILIKKRVFKNKGIFLDISDGVISKPLKKIIVSGRYEKEEAYLIDKYLPRDKNVIELGAGIGFLSCFVSKRLDKDKKFIAIEANPNLIPALERNKRLNGVDFPVFNLAYSFEEKPVKIYLDSDFWASTVFRREKESRKTVVADSTRLRSLC